jgi:hypothetical protein
LLLLRPPMKSLQAYESLPPPKKKIVAPQKIQGLLLEFPLSGFLCSFPTLDRTISRESFPQGPWAVIFVHTPLDWINTWVKIRDILSRKLTTTRRREKRAEMVFVCIR